MRIGILKVGQPPADIESAVGSYPAMIQASLGSAYTYREFDVSKGDLPGLDSAADAYVITGSASSVYDRRPWIETFSQWLKEIDPATPLVGICFGHQIMADAYGGVVERSNRGLAVGLHEYKISFNEMWMDDVENFVLPVVHYDQITKLPPSSRLIATSNFCPYAALSYSDRRAVSFQGHPEFALNFVAMVIERCQQKGTIGIAEAELARASMRQPDDRARVLRWIRQFLSYS